MNLWPHGTITGYTRHRCRCAECREANRQYRIAWRARAPEPLWHDNSTYSNYGCRCDTCRAAHAAAFRRYYRRAS